MANIKNDGTFTPFLIDLKKLSLVKSRGEFTCNNCKQQIPSKSICFGKSGGWWWNRICLNCADEFFNNFIKSVEEFKQIGVRVLEDIKKNERSIEQ